MFAEGIFRDVFKIGHICCIYKGLNAGLKSSKSSWRPITLLPTLSKVAESVLHKRLLDHFIENNVISKRQAAYLKGDSTIQQVLYIRSSYDQNYLDKESHHARSVPRCECRL